MESKTHTVDELRTLYIQSPVAITQKVNIGDKIYTDNDWLENLVLILKKCGLAYKVETHDLAGKSVHEVTIEEMAPKARG
ncbi:hypothetical protein IDJ77_11910 [Mucilaginibacter sp. ZT4R22]|uniref:Uncharacterized protein n=1 Tax=Mucilaginibacter pankratovii TaxID=2772110 RepID=A0ABR7WQC0_9SPHI|nr:hypothetical protein [Mucilaginibacter pankratovii]MBD1364515.1 hypothetical protein [Mucilaginibacter pankratovii]